MRSVTMVELRRHADRVIDRVSRGESLVLTHRGRPIMRLEPIEDRAGAESDDPFYRLDELAVDAGESLSNDEIDRAIYGG